jgi:hypothetical protein
MADVTGHSLTSRTDSPLQTHPVSCLTGPSDACGTLRHRSSCHRSQDMGHSPGSKLCPWFTSWPVISLGRASRISGPDQPPWYHQSTRHTARPLGCGFAGPMEPMPVVLTIASPSTPTQSKNPAFRA